MAIRIARELAPGLAARPLCTMSYVLVAAAAYLDQHGVPATPAALAQHRAICLRHVELGGSWNMQRGLEHVTVAVQSRVSINKARP